MTLTELVREAHLLATEKGWWDGDEHNIPEKLMLVVSELAEALELYRINHRLDHVFITDTGKPEGFGIELADAVIRIADLCGFLDIDLETLVARKHVFNRTRPYRHGNRRA